MKKTIAFVSSIYPSFKSVKRWFYKEECSDIPFYIIYPIAILLLTLLYICIGIILVIVWASLSKSTISKYPSKKYRKVIKEGILWDSVEYHER